MSKSVWDMIERHAGDGHLYWDATYLAWVVWDRREQRIVIRTSDYDVALREYSRIASRGA